MGDSGFVNESDAPTEGLRDIELRTQRSKSMDVTSIYNSMALGTPLIARGVPQVEVPAGEWQTPAAKQSWNNKCKPSDRHISKAAKTEFRKVLAGGKKPFAIRTPASWPAYVCVQSCYVPSDTNLYLG